MVLVCSCSLEVLASRAVARSSTVCIEDYNLVI